MTSFEETTAPGAQDLSSQGPSGQGPSAQAAAGRDRAAEDLAADDAALVEETLAATAPPTDEPAPSVQAATPKPAPAQAATPAGEAAPQPDHRVPLSEYLREREERQNYQRQLEAYRAREKPLARPDPFLDPQGFVNAQLRAQMDPVVQQLKVAIAHNNKSTAVGVHGAELAERAQTEFDRALPQLDTTEALRVLQAPNPFLAAVDWLRQRELLAEVGGDPKAYREKILAEALSDPEFLGRAGEAARSYAAGNTRPGARLSARAQLPSLNRSGSAASSAALAREPTDLELAQEALARR